MLATYLWSSIDVVFSFDGVVLLALRATGRSVSCGAFLEGAGALKVPEHDTTVVLPYLYRLQSGHFVVHLQVDRVRIGMETATNQSVRRFVVGADESVAF